MEASKSRRGGARWWSLPRYYIVAPCAGAALALLVISLHLLHNAPAPEAMRQRREGPAVCARKQWCCGHRGARTLAPENTVSAFLTALKVGANCIEMDVHRTRDGKVAVLHANHLRSKVLPSNGHTSDAAEFIRVEDAAWDSLQGLDAGSWFGETFRNERIPQLTTVLDMFWDVDVRLIVELKAEKCANSSQCERLWKWEHGYAESLKEALIRAQKDHFGAGSPPRFSMLFTSFNHSLVDELAEALASLSKLNPLASRLVSGLGYILDPHFNYTGDKFKDSVTWLAPHVSKVTHVEHLWRSSRCVSSWVTDSRETIEQQFKLGVQAVTTNFPSLCPTIRLAP